jgi:hypothetical protein
VKRVFSTADVEPRDRLAYWHDVVCSNIVDRDFTPESPATFQADLHMGAIGDIGLALCATSPMNMVHATHHIGQTQTDDLFCIPADGGNARRGAGRPRSRAERG